MWPDPPARYRKDGSPRITGHSRSSNGNLARVHFENCSACEAHGMTERSRDPLRITGLLVTREQCVDFNLKDVGVGFRTQRPVPQHWSRGPRIPAPVICPMGPERGMRLKSWRQVLPALPYDSLAVCISAVCAYGEAKIVRPGICSEKAPTSQKVALSRACPPKGSKSCRPLRFRK